MSEMTNEDLVRNLMHAVENDHDSGADTYSDKVKGARAAVLARMVEPLPTTWTFVGCLWTDEMEAEARQVYEGWSDQPGYVSWVERGNSEKQDDARRRVLIKPAPSASTP